MAHPIDSDDSVFGAAHDEIGKPTSVCGGIAPLDSPFATAPGGMQRLLTDRAPEPVRTVFGGAR